MKMTHEERVETLYAFVERLTLRGGEVNRKAICRYLVKELAAVEREAREAERERWQSSEG